MKPELTALPPELLLRIAQLTVEQAEWGAPKMVQAVRFASVCWAFRAAAVSPDFWPLAPQLELHWSPAGAFSSSLVRQWAPCFWAVYLHGTTAWVGVKYKPVALLQRASTGQRLLCIDVTSSEQRPCPALNPGVAQVLTSCLIMAGHLGPVITDLRIRCDRLSPADVQLLAGLRPADLHLEFWSGCSITELPATRRTSVQFWARDIAAVRSFGPMDENRDAWHACLEGLNYEPPTPLYISWAAMTAARASSFLFSGPTRVTDFSEEPLQAVSVEVHTNDFVEGLPWADMTAGRAGWRRNGSQYSRGCHWPSSG